ncbi:MAG: glycosyltransferase [Bacteroidales bacterium]|nr:glycosyltransferase [Bacteroidales bacterium]
MKFLFVIQGEGRGHFSQAIALQQKLQVNGHEVEQVLIGKSPFRKIPDYVTLSFKDKIQCFDSPNFLPTKRYTPLLLSIVYNLWHAKRYFAAMRFLKNAINQSKADRVINFYEPMLGLTYKRYAIAKPMICIAHQYAYLHKEYVFPKCFVLRKYFLKRLTQITAWGAMRKIGLSFENMPDVPQQNLYIIPPLLRQDILNAKSENIAQKDYYLVYLLNDGFLQDFENHVLKSDIIVFSAQESISKNPRIHFQKMADQAFVNALLSAKAVVTTAGFELVAEAMFLDKPLLLIPVNFEQKTNAFSAQKVGDVIVANKIDMNVFEQLVEHTRSNATFPQWVLHENNRIDDLITM